MTDSLLVLAAQVQHERELREKLETLLNERDRANKDAVAAALAAQKELTNTAFASSEKAIIKAENAQTSYNERTNELRGALNDQAKMLLARSEAESRFAALDEKIEEIKKEQATARLGGKDEALVLSRSQQVWVRGALMTGVLSVIGFAITIILFLLKTP